MNVSIDSSLTEQLPGFSLGFIRYSSVQLSDSPKLLQGRINLYMESLRMEHDPAELNKITNVKAWRTTFKKIGIDPSRYRPSSEALLRRILQGHPFMWINTAVDVNNFLSIRYALPFGVYNASRVSGSVVCRLGNPDEHYQGLNGREVDMNKKLLLADDLGPFGSPIVDSTRTMVTEEADSLYQFIFFTPNISPDVREEIVGSAARMMTEINGGEAIQTAVVSLS